MKARPVVFSGPMVCALLAGTKTQTRRLMKPQPEDCDDHAPRWAAHAPDGWWCRTCGNGVWHRDFTGIPCPYGVSGDLLIVREAHSLVPASAYRMSEGVQQAINPDDTYQAAIYAAGWDRSIPKWRPSIHMPRWASRLTLEITDVRVERLQAISEADAAAEGISSEESEELPGHFMTAHRYPSGPDEGFVSAQSAYRHLWDSINAKKAPWSSNPWVWAVSFEVHRQNVNALLRERGVS